MSSISEMLVAHTELGAKLALPRAGTALENPHVYDSVARDIKKLALRGQVEVLTEELAHAGSGSLIRHLEFKRLR